MFPSSSYSYNDPAVCHSAGPPSLTGTLNPYATAALYDATTPPYSLSSSLPSSNNYFMHRSNSTHSFTPHHRRQACSSVPDPTPAAYFSSSPPSSACDILDFPSEPVRRVYSADDLQGMNCLQGSTCTQEDAAAAAAGRVGRYTAEERMRRIERYRIKRNQRNFHKKITYACRKTLADSRPRVRGRFARNGEAEPEAEADASEIAYERYNHHNTHTNAGCASYDNHDNGGNAGEWWRQMQAALTTADEEDVGYDEELWASFDSVCHMNLLS